MFGVTFSTETATIVPSGWNTCVIPAFRPISPMLIARCSGPSRRWRLRSFAHARSKCARSGARHRLGLGTNQRRRGSIAGSSHLDLDVDASGQAESHQGVDGLRRGVEDVDEPLVGSDLELLPAVLVDERRA